MAVVETKDVFLEGCAFYKKGQYDEALKNFESIWETNPDHFENLSMLSTTLVKLHRHEEALSVCEEALAIQKDDVTLLNNKGYIESLIGDNNKAIDTFDRIIRRDDKNITALFNKALCLSRLQKHHESIATYEKILQIDDKNINAIFNRGNDLYQLGRYNEAIASYDRVLQVDSNHSGAQTNKSLSLQRLEEEKSPIPTISFSNSKDDNKKLIGKLKKWIEAGRPSNDEQDEPLDVPLLEVLPEDNEEAIKIINNFETWVDNDMPAIDPDDPEVDPITKQMAAAMTYYDHTAKKELDDKVKEANKKRIFPRPSKTKILLFSMIVGVIMVAAYDAYPEYFDPEYLLNLSFTSTNLVVSELPIPTAEEVVFETIEPFKAEISENVEFERAIEDAFNAKRSEAGRAPFVPHPDLIALALRHSQDMANHQRVDKSMSSDGLSVTREYADKLSLCVSHSAHLESNIPKSGLNVFGGQIPIDDFAAEEIVKTWLDKDIKETILRHIIYENVGTGVTITDDQTVYVSQIYC